MFKMVGFEYFWTQCNCSQLDPIQDPITLELGFYFIVATGEIMTLYQHEFNHERLKMLFM